MQDILKAYGLLVQIPVGQNDAPPVGQNDADVNNAQPTNQDLQNQLQQAQQDLQQQETQISRQITETPQNPIQVVPATDPIQYLNYGIQGVIFLIIITFGKPLIDQFSLLFSERARIRASKEDKVLDVQMTSSKMILEQQADQREFLQSMIQSQQERMTGDVLLERETAAKRMEQIFNKLDEQTRVMRNTNLIMREVAALINYQHRVNTGQSIVVIPELYDEEKDLEKASVDTITLTNPLTLPPDNV